MRSRRQVGPRRPKRHSPSRFLGQEAKAVRVEGRTIILKCVRCGGEMREEAGNDTVARMLAMHWGLNGVGSCASFCPRCDTKDGYPKQRS